MMTKASTKNLQGLLRDKLLGDYGKQMKKIRASKESIESTLQSDEDYSWEIKKKKLPKFLRKNIQQTKIMS